MIGSIGLGFTSSLSFHFFSASSTIPFMLVFTCFALPYCVRSPLSIGPPFFVGLCGLADGSLWLWWRVCRGRRSPTILTGLTLRQPALLKGPPLALLLTVYTTMIHSKCEFQNRIGKGLAMIFQRLGQAVNPTLDYRRLLAISMNDRVRSLRIFSPR